MQDIEFHVQASSRICVLLPLAGVESAQFSISFNLISLMVEKIQENQHIYDFTVVTPSYNQAAFLEQTLLSVLNQEQVTVQYIVIDNCSDDGSSEILERYRDRIDTLIIEPDKGQADALCKGFAMAKGRYCCYLNSDDCLLPHALVRVRDYFDTHDDVDVLYSHRVFVDAQGRLLKYWILPPHINYLMMRWDYIPQECSFWRGSLMRHEGGIDSSFRFAMDYDWFTRLMVGGYQFQKMNAFLGVFRVHEDSKTTQLVHTIGKQEMLQVMQRYNIRVRLWDMVIAAALYLYINTSSFIYKLFSKPPVPKSPD